jgi:hypothetical protein
LGTAGQIAGAGEQVAHHGREDNNDAHKGCDCGAVVGLHGSAQTDLGQNALAGEQFGAQTDHEAQHGQTTIPGLGEGDESDAVSPLPILLLAVYFLLHFPVDCSRWALPTTLLCEVRTFLGIFL